MQNFVIKKKAMPSPQAGCSILVETYAPIQKLPKTGGARASQMLQIHSYDSIEVLLTLKKVTACL